MHQLVTARRQPGDVQFLPFHAGRVGIGVSRADALLQDPQAGAVSPTRARVHGLAPGLRLTPVGGLAVTQAQALLGHPGPEAPALRGEQSEALRAQEVPVLVPSEAHVAQRTHARSHAGASAGE